MDIRALLDAVVLEDVRVIQSEAILKLDPAPDTGLAAFGEPKFEGELDLNLNPISWGRRIETWFRVTIEDEHAVVTCAVATMYARDSDDEVPLDVRVEFLEKVAVMAAYPYIRANIQAQASNLRIGNVTLGMLRQGEFKIAAAAE